MVKNIQSAHVVLRIKTQSLAWPAHTEFNSENNDFKRIMRHIRK